MNLYHNLLGSKIMVLQEVLFHCKVFWL